MYFAKWHHAISSCTCTVQPSTCIEDAALATRMKLGSGVMHSRCHSRSFDLKDSRLYVYTCFELLGAQTTFISVQKNSGVSIPKNGSFALGSGNYYTISTIWNVIFRRFSLSFPPFGSLLMDMEPEDFWLILWPFKWQLYFDWFDQ